MTDKPKPKGRNFAERFEDIDSEIPMTQKEAVGILCELGIRTGAAFRRLCEQMGKTDELRANEELECKRKMAAKQ